MYGVSTMVADRPTIRQGCREVLRMWEKACTDLGLTLPDPPLPESPRVSTEDSLVAAIDSALGRAITKICEGISRDSVRTHGGLLTVEWCAGAKVVGCWAGPTANTEHDIRAILLEAIGATFGTQHETVLAHLSDSILLLMLRAELDLKPLLRKSPELGPRVLYLFTLSDDEHLDS